MKVAEVLLEMDAADTAAIETGAADDSPEARAERIRKARMSDAERQKETRDELTDLKRSTDPIDRQIAQLREKLAQLMKQKEQKEKQGV